MSRSLNDIIPPSRRRQMGMPQAETPTYSGAPVPPPPPRRPSAPRPRSNRRFPYGTALIALVVVALSAGALFMFSGAKVEVTPATNQAYISGAFTATLGTGELPFEVVSVEKIATKSVPAETTETKNDPAQGVITIYNAQTTPQQLIKNTRFQTPDGLIFRIRDSVTVPAGSPNAPGKMDVTVYADEGGEKYNIPPSDFTVPGLEGSKSYDLVYAKSAAAMTGGFSGTRPTVSEATKDAQAEGLRSALETDLSAGIAEAVPEGFVIVPGSTYTVLETLPDTAGQGNNVDVKMKGVTYAVVFPNEALAKAIAYQVVGTYSGQPVLLQDATSLTLKPAVEGNPQGLETYAFNLEGNASIVWKIDQARIAGAVAGKTRDGAQVILSGFPEVDRAVLVLRPFWSNSFPSDPEKITVSVKEAAKSGE